MKPLHFTIVTIIFLFSQLLSASNAQTITSHRKSGKANTPPSYKTVSFDTTANYSAKEKKIFDLVFNIPEVKALAIYIEKHFKHKRHLLMSMAGTPTTTNKYYWVQVGEENEVLFMTHYHFYVYTNPTRIYFLDTVNDETISLKEWRRRNRK